MKNFKLTMKLFYCINRCRVEDEFIRAWLMYQVEKVYRV